MTLSLTCTPEALRRALDLALAPEPRPKAIPELHANAAKTAEVHAYLRRDIEHLFGIGRGDTNPKYTRPLARVAGGGVIARSEVEQEAQRPSDREELFFVRGAEPRDESLVGDGLHVFTLRVAELVEATRGSVEFHCDGRSRRAVVQGTTITTPAGLSLRRSADTTTAGRWPDCSRPIGSPKSTSQISPRLALTSNDRRKTRSPVSARPRLPPRLVDLREARRTAPQADRRTAVLRARPRLLRAAQSSVARSLSTRPRTDRGSPH